MKKSIIMMLLTLLMIFSFSCKKSSNEEGIAKDNILTNKTNIKKTGDLELRITSVLKSKQKIVDIAEKYKAQIIRENIYNNSKLVKTGSFQIKVKAEDFSVVFNELSNLGKIIKTNIWSDDISDKKTKNNDQIELLKQRLVDAEKTSNEELKDSLKEKLYNLQITQKEISDVLLYSYIFLELNERPKFIYSIISGFIIGIDGLYYAIKYTIIVIMYLIPLFVFIIIFRIMFALIKWKWKYFLKKVELTLGKNEKEKMK